MGSALIDSDNIKDTQEALETGKCEAPNTNCRTIGKRCQIPSYLAGYKTHNPDISNIKQYEIGKLIYRLPTKSIVNQAVLEGICGRKDRNLGLT